MGEIMAFFIIMGIMSFVVLFLAMGFIILYELFKGSV
jgi:hypothetical protein